MDKELELMIQMKAQGKSDREVGFAITKSIYGQGNTRLDLQFFAIALGGLLEDMPDDEYLLGSKEALKEILDEAGC